MDPYRILGVSRTCTREELKAAFRARVWTSHPDRGGQDEAFIRLCEAYKRILEELDRRPKPAARDRAGTPHHGRPWAPLDGGWEPDLILLDEPPGPDRPPNPPDPNWRPDLILLDQPPAVGRFREPVGPDVSGKDYVSWLRRVSDRVSRRESIWQSMTVRAIGVVLLFGALGGNLWLCWLAWTYDPVEAARQAELAASNSQRAGTQGRP